jgi:hypothetical protein
VIVEINHAIAYPSRAYCHIQPRRTALTDFFPGFEHRRIATSGADINLVTGGSGPPLLCCTATHRPI